MAIRRLPPAKARHQPVLPAPLTDEIIQTAMPELSEGTRRALETCYSCFKDHKFTPGDFLSFLRSISHQSATLTVVFRESIAAEQRCNSLASFKASDFQEATPAPAHLAWGSEAVGAIPAIRISSEPSARSPSSSPGVVDAAPAGAMVDVNDKPEEAMDMTAKLITRRRIEATRRQYGRFPGTDAQRRKGFVISTIRRLRGVLPDAARPRFLAALTAYNAGETCPAQFRETLQQMVDDLGIVLGLEYTPEHMERSHHAPAKRSRGGQDLSKVEPAPKKTKVKTEPVEAPCAPAPAGCPACDLDILSDASPGSGKCKQYGGGAAAPSSGRRAASKAPLPTAPPSPTRPSRLSPSVPRGPSSRGSSVVDAAASVAQFPDTALSSFLTAQARRATSVRRNVRVKVVSHTVKHTGGGTAPRYPFHAKTILAFHELDGVDVVIFGMFVHEFGADAPAPAAGRVSIECIDSVPLHESERSDERQKLLSAIVHSYLRYIRAQGFTHLHLRVPPPSAENSHIFAPRSLAVRLEATIRMGQWFKRLLEGAKSEGIVASFKSSALLSRMHDFPPCILLPTDLAEEHAYSAMKAAVSRQLAECEDAAQAAILARMVSAKERFFVAELFDARGAEPVPRLELDVTAQRACPVSASRPGLTAFCQERALGFGSVAAAKAAMGPLLSAMLLARDDAEAPRRGARGKAAAVKVERQPEAEALPMWVQQQQQLILANDTFEDPPSIGKGAPLRQDPAVAAAVAMELDAPDAPDAPLGGAWEPVQEQACSSNLVEEDCLMGKLDCSELCGNMDDTDLFADSFFSA